MFVTHGDQDHISGIRGMLTDQEFGIEICNLVLPPQEYHDDMLRELMYTAAAAGTRILIMEPGDRISDNGLELECLAPGTEAGLEPGNEASLVLEASYGGFRMLLTGDVEGPGEQALIKSGRLEKCDVLKAAHHGSGNSGSEEFLKITQPAVSVISAGRDNRYGHPHPDTTKRLKECGSRYIPLRKTERSRYVRTAARSDHGYGFRWSLTESLVKTGAVSFIIQEL